MLTDLTIVADSVMCKLLTPAGKSIFITLLIPVCVGVWVPYTKIFRFLCICAHGHIRVVCVVLCLSGHEESCAYLQYVGAFLHCYHFLELNRLRETEGGREK